METSNVISITARLEKAWQRYLDAKSRAEATGSLQDGIAAGRAWGAWLKLFEPRP